MSEGERSAVQAVPMQRVRVICDVCQEVVGEALSAPHPDREGYWVHVWEPSLQAHQCSAK